MTKEEVLNLGVDDVWEMFIRENESLKNMTPRERMSFYMGWNYACVLLTRENIEG